MKKKFVVKLKISSFLPILFLSNPNYPLPMPPSTFQTSAYSNKLCLANDMGLHLIPIHWDISFLLKHLNESKTCTFKQ